MVKRIRSVFLLLNFLAVVILITEATVVKNSQVINSELDLEDEANEVQVHGTRTKRYTTIGRIPLAYINANKGHSNGRKKNEENARDQQERNSPISHFRGFRLNDDPSRSRADIPDSIVESEGNWEDALEGPEFNGQTSYLPYLMARRNQRRFPGSLRAHEGKDITLNDQDLETLLLLLDGYALDTNTMQGQTNRDKSPAPPAYYNPTYMSPEDLVRVSRMYAVGKRGQFEDDEPASHYTSLPIQTRKKRIGARTLFAMENVPRIKKETDPKIEAQLQKIFGSNEHLHDNLKKAQEKPLDHGSPNPPLLSGGHHTENHNQNSTIADKDIKSPVAKKDIDWSYYFGVDKKKDATVTDAKTPNKAEKTLADNDKPVKAKQRDQTVATHITSKAEKTKESKAMKQREENETEDKSDRKWILKEFYKNLAMSTNIKRKRESTAQQEDDNVTQIEQQMEAAGDKLIWDALKYTGAHKDEEMSESQLAEVKQHIIEKLSAAYSLEKLRQQLEEFRQELNPNPNDNYDTLN